MSVLNGTTLLFVAGYICLCLGGCRGRYKSSCAKYKKITVCVLFQSQDATDVSMCIAPSCLCLLLKRLWRQRVPHLQALLNRLEEVQQKLIAQAIGRRAVNGTLDACPLDLSIAAGWIRKPLPNGTYTQIDTNQNSDAEVNRSVIISTHADRNTETHPVANSVVSRER